MRAWPPGCSAEQHRDCPRADTQRDAITAAMALALARTKRRLWLAAGSAMVVAAAATTLFVVWSSARNKVPGVGSASASALVVERETGRGNLLVRAGSARPLPAFEVLAAGDSVRSDADSSATLSFRNGTRIMLSPLGHLRVDELGPTRWFSLLGGRLQVRVAKLAPRERFVVATPDAEVEVRGTEFTVAVNEAASSCPRLPSSSTVLVSEGAVWVRSQAKEVVLHPGETWSTPCADVRPSAPTAPESAQAPDRAGAPVPRAPSARASRHTEEVVVDDISSAARMPGLAPRPPVTTSSLAEQNDSFSAAATAERQGQHDLALRKLDDLLARFADGPLGESARAERERILSAQPSHR